MEGKTLRKGRFEYEGRKRHEKCQQAVHDHTTMEKSWVMMMDRTDKEHEE